MNELFEIGFLNLLELGVFGDVSAGIDDKQLSNNCVGFESTSIDRLGFGIEYPFELGGVDGSNNLVFSVPEQLGRGGGVSFSILIRGCFAGLCEADELIGPKIGFRFDFGVWNRLAFSSLGMRL